ncbi:hypothetical protein PYWP30_00934 [Pyrobaculum sp. WP30]|nr:hypothetical protein PYWP30_00934 [Pyrobaculum sp. WP30]
MTERDDEYQRRWAGAYGVAPPWAEGVCLSGRALGEFRPLGSGVGAPRAEASRGGREGRLCARSLVTRWQIPAPSGGPW